MKKAKKLTEKKGLINTYNLTNVFLNKRTLQKKKSNISFGKSLQLFYFCRKLHVPFLDSSRATNTNRYEVFSLINTTHKTNLNNILMFY